MSDRDLEIIAEIQGEDLDEIKSRLTSKTSEDLREEAEEHLESKVGNTDTDEALWDLTLHSRAQQADMNTGTYKRRERELLRFCDWYENYDREQIDQQTIEDYLRDQKDEGYAENTLESRYWALITFLKEELNGTIEAEARDARRKDIISDDGDEDNAHPRKSKGARPIEADEKEAMAEEAPSLRLELCVRILWQTGLRVKELANLRVDQVNLENWKLEDVETAKRQDGDTRTLSFNYKLKNKLDRWMNGGYREKYTQAENSPYLLPTHKSEKVYPRNLGRSIRKLAEDAGVQSYTFEHAQDGGKRAEITPHSFRKAFGIQRLREGMSVREVQLLLGHSDISTTQHYLELDDDDLDYTPRTGSQEQENSNPRKQDNEGDTIGDLLDQ